MTGSDRGPRIDAPSPEQSARRSSPDAQSAASTLKLGILKAGGLRLGVPIDALSEVCTVSRLGPSLVPWRGALGTLDLRGLLVPIFDHAVLTGRRDEASDRPPPFGAILRHGDHLIGIGIEEVEGFTEVGPQMLQPITQARIADGEAGDGKERHGPPRENHALAGCLQHAGAVVSVIDTAALFAPPGLPMAVRRRPSGNDGDGHGRERAAPRGSMDTEACARTREPALAFSAGGATFALPASAIHATVPRTVVERNALSEGACIGSIMHHGQRVPVMRTTTVMALGHADDGREAEIVLLRCGDARRIGLAVDMIKRMLSVDHAQLRPAPSGIGRAARLITGVTTDAASGDQIFVIDARQLITLPDMAEMAALSERKSPPRAAARSSDTDVTEDRTRHLVFSAGTLVATPVAQVARIVTPPDTIVPAPDAGLSGVLGLFSLDTHSVLYIDLARMLGLHATEPISRVLVVENEANMVGFAVTRVADIDNSAWRRRDERSGGEIVQLGQGDGRRILPAVDLARLATRVLQ